MFYDVYDCCISEHSRNKYEWHTEPGSPLEIVTARAAELMSRSTPVVCAALRIYIGIKGYGDHKRDRNKTSARGLDARAHSGAIPKRGK